MLFRGLFIFFYSSQLNGDFSEIFMALWLGFRLSLKTAGILALGGFIFSTIPQILKNSAVLSKIRLYWHSLALMIFSVLFMTRIPYYKIFNATFNMMVINGAKDDIFAIIVTAFSEYQAWWRLPVALFIAVLLIRILQYFWQYTANLNFLQIKHKLVMIVVTLIFLPVLWIFVRYGGAMSYANSINWESAARLNSNLLNEAILDDGQALYRVYAGKRILDKVNNINISSADLQKKIIAVGGLANTNTVEDAFLHKVTNPKLSVQPQNVVLIVGESFGQWPFLSKYQNLGLVNNMQNLQKTAYSASIETMIPHGDGTIAAVNGLVTGLSAAGLYANYQPESFNSQYSTGIGYIMHQLGYKTVFWYGGFSGWQNIRKFVLAQNFDEFHCADEFTHIDGNAWGCSDEILFKNIAEYIKHENDKKVFHVILTTSNHPPYSIDVDSLGFPRDKIRNLLPKDISRDEKTLTELGHIWYADKTMGDFITDVENYKKDTLFIITGDHSERFSFALEQDIRTLSSIPCIFYGFGVEKNWFGEKSKGCHAQLAATIAEIIAPQDFVYSAYFPSMFDDNEFVFNHRLYVDGNNIDKIAHNKLYKVYADKMRNIAAWRLLRGNEF